jgi:hypothetical protein
MIIRSIILGKALFQCYNRENSCFRIKGFTQEPISMQFYIITKYAKSGNLRQYLLKNPNLSWKDRLFIIWDISLDLERIHKAGNKEIHNGVAFQILVFQWRLVVLTMQEKSMVSCLISLRKCLMEGIIQWNQIYTALVLSCGSLQAEKHHLHKSLMMFALH